MSLLDDVSIVVTPNGYKAGELYAVIPSNGDADMDVTRATDATRVDENGLVNYAEVIGGDLITDGDFPSLTNWSVNNAACDIVGGKAVWTSAPNATGFTGINLNNAICEIGKTYKITYTIDSITEGGLRLRFPDFGTQYNSSGTYPLTVTNTLTATSTNIYFQGLGTITASISNVSVKEVTRDNVPRIDYTGGGCPHILAEPQRTNLITYSEDFSDSSWTKTGSVSVSSNSVISPDGTLNGSTITGLTGSGSNDLRFITGLNPASTTYTSSVYLKGSGTIKMKISNNVDNSGNTTITLTSSWVRYDLTHTFNATTGSLGLTLDDSGGATATTYDIWGAQLEEGSYATSYIPTSGSTVTRNQDIFTRDGIGSLINSTEGVLFIEMAALSNDLTYRSFMLNDGTNDNRMIIRYSNASNTLQALCYISTGLTGFCQYVLTDETLFSKIAFKWKVNDFALWVDGVEVATDTSGAVPTGLNTLEFNTATDTQHLLAKVKQLQVYKTALTDTQLAALTS